MIKKILLVASLAFLSLACSVNPVASPLYSWSAGRASEAISKKDLLREKMKIDKLLAHQKSEMWVKLFKKDTLVQVMEGQFPEDVGTIFNIAKDKQGHILKISEVPYIEGNHWGIVSRHYFDQEGRTFVFERIVTALDASCPNESIWAELTRETIVKLYSSSFTLLDSTYKMIDEKGKDITSKKCELQVSSETKVFKDLTTYLAANRLSFK